MSTEMSTETKVLITELSDLLSRAQPLADRLEELHGDAHLPRLIAKWVRRALEDVTDAADPQGAGRHECGDLQRLRRDLPARSEPVDVMTDTPFRDIIETFCMDTGRVYTDDGTPVFRYPVDVAPFLRWLKADPARYERFNQKRLHAMLDDDGEVYEYERHAVTGDLSYKDLVRYFLGMYPADYDPRADPDNYDSDGDYYDPTYAKSEESCRTSEDRRS